MGRLIKLVTGRVTDGLYFAPTASMDNDCSTWKNLSPWYSEHAMRHFSTFDMWQIS